MFRYAGEPALRCISYHIIALQKKEFLSTQFEENSQLEILSPSYINMNHHTSTFSSILFHFPQPQHFLTVVRNYNRFARLVFLKTFHDSNVDNFLIWTQ